METPIAIDTRHPDCAPRASATEAQLVRLVHHKEDILHGVFSFLGGPEM